MRILRSNPLRRKLLITRKVPFYSGSPSGNTSVIWLSKTGHPLAVNPRDLHVIEQMIWDILRNENVDLILDAVEYLILENGLEATLRFVGKLRDMAVLSNSDFYVVTSDALDERTRSLLRRIVE